MTELEKSIASILESNGLVHFSIDYSAASGDREHRWFGVSMQWLDDAQSHGRGVATGMGDTITDALESALQMLAVKRAATLADEALPMGEAA